MLVTKMDFTSSKHKGNRGSSFSIDRLLGFDNRDNERHNGSLLCPERAPLQDSVKIQRSGYASNADKTYKQNSRSYRQATSPLGRFSLPESNFDCRLLHPSCYRPTVLQSYHPMTGLCLHRPTPCFASTQSAFLNSVGPGFAVNSPFINCPEAVSYKEKDYIASVDFPCRRQTFEDKDESRRKGGQIRFSHVQSMELERVFSHQKYISPQERKQLARALQLSERQVKTWFQNRRAKWRRIRMEAEMRQRMARENRIREQENEATDDEDPYYEQGHTKSLSPNSDPDKSDLNPLE